MIKAVEGSWDNHPAVFEKQYRNYKGEVSLRRLVPQGIEFQETNKWHGENVWILHAFDLDKDDVREFALKDFL